jgi:hypothetical protein
MNEKQSYYRVESELEDNKASTLKREFFEKPTGWFNTEDEAKIDYFIVYQRAMEEADKIKKALKELQKELGFHVSYHMSGDTYGIYEDYQYISFRMSGYDFYFKTED